MCVAWASRGAGACDGRPDATPRRRLGSFTASNGGDLWPQRGARESLLSGYSPGNATLVRYQAAPTARPTVTNAEPFILATRALWRLPRRAGGKGGASEFTLVQKTYAVTMASDVASDSIEDPAWLSLSLGRETTPEWHHDSASRLQVLDAHHDHTNNSN